MKIGFNPAIKNQNTYSVKRNTSEHTDISNNQLAFKKVNQEFYKKAQKSYKKWEDVTSEWYEDFSDEVLLWKTISKQDAIDTMNAIRKFVDNESLDAFIEDLNYYKKIRL